MNCFRFYRQLPNVTCENHAADHADQTAREDQGKGVFCPDHGHAYQDSLCHLGKDRPETIGEAPGVVHNLLLIAGRQLAVFHDIIHDTGTHIFIRPLVEGQNPGPGSKDQQDKGKEGDLHPVFFRKLFHMFKRSFNSYFLAYCFYYSNNAGRTQPGKKRKRPFKFTFIIEKNIHFRQ